MTVKRNQQALWTVCLPITLCLVCMPAYARYGGGSGTGDDPYLLRTAEHLHLLGANSEDWDKRFAVVADIDLSAYSDVLFKEIGTDAAFYPFVGVFDGRNHEISNLTCRSNAPDCVGLFGAVGKTGVVKNVRLVNVNVAGSRHVGGLVGDNDGTVTDCNVSGTVAGTYDFTGGVVGENSGKVSGCSMTGVVRGREDVGGLVGSTTRDSAISDCRASAAVSGDNSVGGLAGSSLNGFVRRCCSAGSVTGYAGVGGLVGYNKGVIAHSYANAAVEGDHGVGGLAGDNSADTTEDDSRCQGIISNCYAEGSVTGDWAVGGLAGYNFETITCSYAAVKVNGKQGTVGGLAGYSDDTDITASFWDVEVSGLTKGGGGVGKTTAELRDPNTYLAAEWDFVSIDAGPTDIWAMPSTGGYPRLWWQHGSLPPLPGFAGGKGTAEDPYVVADANHLNSIGSNPRLMDKCFILAGDIDLQGVRFYSIGDLAHPFVGQFDGRGHVIAHLACAGNTGFVGLFGYIGAGGRVKNLTLTDVKMTGDKWSVGGVAGYSLGDISNIVVTGAVTGIGELAWNVGCGGIAGLSAGTISNCGSNATVQGTRGWIIGGLVGWNRGVVAGSWARGIVGGGEWSLCTGGLVGKNDGTITDSYARGTVMGANQVGGLVGFNLDSVSNCYSTGAVSGGVEVGGLIGDNLGVVTASFWDVEASDQTTSDGGIGRTTAEMQIADTFTDAGWDFVNETPNGTKDLWWIDEGRDYPRLSWELDNNATEGP